MVLNVLGCRADVLGTNRKMLPQATNFFNFFLYTSGGVYVPNGTGRGEGGVGGVGV